MSSGVKITSLCLDTYKITQRYLHNKEMYNLTLLGCSLNSSCFNYKINFKLVSTAWIKLRSVWLITCYCYQWHSRTPGSIKYEQWVHYRTIHHVLDCNWRFLLAPDTVMLRGEERGILWNLFKEHRNVRSKLNWLRGSAKANMQFVSFLCRLNAFTTAPKA